MKKTLTIVLLLSIPAYSLFAQGNIDHWETIVYDSSVWKYFPGISDPGTGWNALPFTDNAWTSGRGGIGYGDGDDRTVVTPVLSVFMRKKFTILDLAKIDQLLLHVDYDDGFIAYINGIEVARAFMGSATNIPYNQASAGLHEALLYQGINPEHFLLQKEMIQHILITGENVLALQVHNDNIGSSDLSASAFLSAGLTDNTFAYGPLPSWFVEPFVFESSDLPIVVINTNFQTITDETRIVADMGIVYNGTGITNYLTDQRNNYDGKISIEYRGESSQMFPKKSFSIETQDSQGNNFNAALLDLPPENDWILYAPYTDKTMLRDVLTFKLGNDLGNYTPRARFVELVLNEEYQGVYVLIEKIKRDQHRVDVATLNREDIAGDALTGGYILRVDKIDENDYPAWTTSSAPRLPGENIINFQYYDPEGEELVEVQRSYIRNFIHQVESSLASASFTNAATGFRKYIDIPSFIDFMLVNEIGKNIDGYIFSTFMYKDKDSKGGKLHMGPLWDFNLAYGNVDYSQNAQFAPGWMWNDQYRMYWFRRMITDPVFSRSLKCRWEELRNSFLTNNYFIHTIDSMATLLEEAQERNYKRWPILGVYVWPNQYVGLTYDQEINFMQQWIVNRLQWMDDNMPGNCDLITDIEVGQEDPVFSIYPNPSDNSFTFSFNPPPGNNLRIEIYNAMGERILVTETTGREFSWEGKNQQGITLSAGLYVACVFSGNTLLYHQRIIKL